MTFGRLFISIAIIALLSFTLYLLIALQLEPQSALTQTPPAPSPASKPAIDGAHDTAALTNALPSAPETGAKPRQPGARKLLEILDDTRRIINLRVAGELWFP